MSLAPFIMNVRENLSSNVAYNTQINTCKICRGLCEWLTGLVFNYKVISPL